MKEKKNIIYIIDCILLIILIITVVFAQVKGKYIDTEIKIVEVCNGNLIWDGKEKTDNFSDEIIKEWKKQTNMNST